MTPSDSIEATASTVEQAISQALDQLGAHQDDVIIEVLTTPRSGVLGLGVRAARVRVSRRAPEIARSTVQSPPPAPPLKRTAPEARLSAPTPPPLTSRPEPRAESRSDFRRDAPSAPVRDFLQPTASGAGDFDGNRLTAPASDTPAPERRGRSGDSPGAASDDRPRRDSPPDRRRGRGSDNRRDDRSGPRPDRDQNRGTNQDRDQNRASNPDRDQSRGTNHDDDRRSENPSDAASPSVQAAGNSRNDQRRDDRRDDSPRPRRDRDRPPRAAGDERRTDSPPRPRPERPRRDDSNAERPSDRDSDLDSFNDDGSGNDQRPLIAPEEQITEAINILTEVLKMMGEQADIETVRDEGLQTVELNIKGDGSGILIGRHGQTLDALEYIVNRILGRRIKDAVAIAIDTESYRARRRGQLHRMALSKGEQAKREHITVTLDPMAPRDRRIVHLALKDDPLITTRSFGDGFLRSIEVVPVDGSHDRGGRDRRERSREPDRDRDRDHDDLPLGQQGGFKHGQKRIV